MTEQLRLLLDAARERERQADEAWGISGDERYAAWKRAQELAELLQSALLLSKIIDANP